MLPTDEKIDTTDILARPNEWARKHAQALSAVRALTEQVETLTSELRTNAAGWRQDQQRLEAMAAELREMKRERNVFKATCFLMESRDWKRAKAARAVAAYARQADMANLTEFEASLRVQAERDAARAEVVKRTTIMQSTAQKAELWLHDADQFSPRTPAGDAVIQDGQLEELAQIISALRGDTAPAVCSECHGTRRVDTELGRIICPMCKDTAPAQPAAPECRFCAIQNGIKSAMDIIETLPEVGEYYDEMLTKAFDALDDAYGWHRHEHTAPVRGQRAGGRECLSTEC